MSVTSRVSIVALAASLVLAGAPAVAQPPAAAAVSRYDAAFFDRSQPSSAYDMILLVPGFRLQEGDAEVRGYSGAGGNVLIDGRRPASKEDTLEQVLKRIPAQSVDRVELIRSSAAGYDMQGYALLANVVRKRTSRMTGRLEGEYANLRHGYDAPRVAGEVNLAWGDRTLDLQGALYRVIDDEHGFGVRNRYLPDGSPLRLADYKQAEGTSYREFSGAYAQPLAGGSFRATGLYKDSRMFADIEHEIVFPADGTIFGTERNHTRATEGEVRWDRPIAASSRVELLAIRRDTRLRSSETSLEDESSEVNHAASDAAETIVRGVLRRKGALLSIELGAEGTINTLDSHVSLAEDGIDVPLPAANVRVEEKRAELFAVGTWQLAPTLTAETGLRFEASRLTQSGDSALQKSLSYLKPRLLVTWAPSEKDQLRALVEREVGQLDFADFVSATSVTGGTITAGNRDLEPYSLWRAELAWEHHIGTGSIVLTGRHEWVSDVVDRIAVVSPEGVFDSAGNIGNGSRNEAQIDLNLPLDGMGLHGVTIKGSGLFRRSRVRDPLTQETRRISGDAPIEATASFTHDIPAAKLRWGVNYVIRKEETAFKVDEVEFDRLSDRVDAFVEYKPDARWTIRLFGKNLTDTSALRSRDIYSGLRGSSGLDFREVRVLRSGRYFGINLQRVFGG